MASMISWTVNILIVSLTLYCINVSLIDILFVALTILSLVKITKHYICSFSLILY